MKKKFLATALATVMAVTSAAAVSAVQPVELGSISGDLTVNGFYNETTNAVELKSGDSYTFEFNNKSNGAANWENFLFSITSAVGEGYVNAEQEVLFIRADIYAWAAGDVSDFPKFGEENPSNPIIWNSDIAWDEWVAAMQAGTDVRATIARDGDTINYNATIGEWKVGFSAKSGRTLPESLYLFLSGENCTLTGITVTDNNAPEETEPETTEPETTEPEATEPEATEPEATEPEATQPEATEPEATQPEATEPEATEPEATEPDMIEVPAPAIELGDLNVTAFFGAKTKSVEFKSGDTYTFTFHNKSNGTNNWDNFVLAIADVADTANYPENGIDHEVVVIRADNYGWGGGLSDLGDNLTFENTIDWDNWAEFCKAGFDVKIELTRNGNTITYKATMGDNQVVSLTATSGKDLPENLYVFLTGENCDLTGIKATPVGKTVLVPNPNGGSGSDGKPTPDTGVAAPYAVAALAIVAVGTAVVLKKKSK